MKKFFKGLLSVIAVIILVVCAVIVYQLATGNDIDFPSFINTSSSPEQTTADTPEVPDETAGGNAGEMQYRYYRVTVSEDRYYTTDGELTFDELVSGISALDEDYVVEIIDDNATLKAYKALTDMLDEKSVAYMEDDGEIHT